MNNTIKINNKELIEFEGVMLSKKTVERILRFREENSENLIEKPNFPKVDSKGRPINHDNHPTYVKLLRKESVPTYMRSKRNKASDAMMYSAFEGKWIETPDLWQEYVYNGSLGVDYIYVDDKTIQKFIKNCK